MTELEPVVDHIETAIPNPRLSDTINRSIVRSVIDGGIYLAELPVNARLVIRTKNHTYHLLKRNDEEFLLSGHPRFCPDPVTVKIHGSTWGGSMLKTGFLGRGMRMEFQHPDYSRPITTSSVTELYPVQ